MIMTVLKMKLIIELKTLLLLVKVFEILFIK